MRFSRVSVVYATLTPIASDRVSRYVSDSRRVVALVAS